MTEDLQLVEQPWQLTPAGRRLAGALAWAQRWKRLAKRLRGEVIHALDDAERWHRELERVVFRGELVMLRAKYDRDLSNALIAHQAEVTELRDALEGREIQIRTLAKEIERWQSRIVQHKQMNRSLNLENQALYKRLRWLEDEQHEWELGRGEKRLLRKMREAVGAWRSGERLDTAADLVDHLVALLDAHESRS